MSTVVDENSLLIRDSRVSSSASRYWSSSTSSTSDDSSLFESHERSPRRVEPKLGKRIVRRLSGILLQIDGDVAKVLLKSGEKSFHYRIPAKNLERMGIQFANQPFEFDEIELDVGGQIYPSHEFRPLAGADAAYIDEVEMTPEMSRDEELINRAFGQPRR